MASELYGESFGFRTPSGYFRVSTGRSRAADVAGSNTVRAARTSRLVSPSSIPSSVASAFRLCGDAPSATSWSAEVIHRPFNLRTTSSDKPGTPASGVSLAAMQLHAPEPPALDYYDKTVHVRQASTSKPAMRVRASLHSNRRPECARNRSRTGGLTDEYLTQGFLSRHK